MNELSVILFGVGGVGRALVRQILEARDLHAHQYGIFIRILALCDSRSAVVEPTDGLTDKTLREILTLKESGKRLERHPLGGTQDDLTAIVDIVGRPDTVVIDCTASTDTVPALLFALDRNYKVILANKKPLTIQQEVYDRLTRAGGTAADPRDLGCCRWEATVGAGLPVIASLNRLVSSGDSVSRIAGTFSGTLGYVMSGLEAGHAFSQVVQEAYRQGYTEPDPRDDLGGMDVARKALILARGLGWQIEMENVAVTSLYAKQLVALDTSDLDTLPVADFLAALPGLDAYYKERVAEAADQGQVLRYVATIADGACRVGLTAVDEDSPLGRLTGTDNLVEITSRWYNPTPLVIQGRGAGPDATAAGVLSDVVELAFTR